MKAITLRNLSPEVARIILQKAKKGGKSINKTVLEMLEEGVGTRQKKKSRPVYNDLDFLAGSWTGEEEKFFDQALTRQRTIDPNLWK